MGDEQDDWLVTLGVSQDSLDNRGDSGSASPGQDPGGGGASGGDSGSLSPTVVQPEPLADGLSCFREKTVGVYKTFKKGALKPAEETWIFIHDGPCQCEGKTGDVCQEPGDDN
jgi:hypothetical protein